MPRKPAHLEMAGGRGPRQRIWEAIRTKRKAFTAADISRASKIEIDPVRAYMRSLARAEYIAADDVAVGQEKRWDLMRDIGAFAPRLQEDGTPVTQGIANENMWRTMHIMGKFTAAELASMASTEDVKVAEQTAKTYLRMLMTAGYLAIVEEGHPFIRGVGAKQTKYRFASPEKYTGPRPPMVQRTKCVYDPNLAKIMWQEEPDHDAC